jgi:Rad3-related DNA helicase
MRQVIINPDDVPINNMTQAFQESPFMIPRREQEQVIPIILEALERGDKNIIVECPTGTGKSAISYLIPTIQNQEAYILTHLKGLQEQYLRELPMMSNVMGKNNYNCKLEIPQGCTDETKINQALKQALLSDPDSDKCSADLAPCSTMENFNCPFKISIGESTMDKTNYSDNTQSLCGYYQSLHDATNGQFFLTNASYLMRMWPSGLLPQREILIVDEAHNLAPTLINHYSLDISQKILEILFDIPTYKDIQEAKGDVKARYKTRRDKLLKAWNPKEGHNAGVGIPSVPSITTRTSKRLWEIGAKVYGAYCEYLLSIIEPNLKNKVYKGGQLKVAKNFYDNLRGMRNKLIDWNNWVWTRNDELSPTRIIFKPLSIKKEAERLIHSSGEQRVFMSATIGDVDVFCEELGLKSEETTFIKIDYSSFPMENRPIYTHLTGGNLNYGGKTEDDYFKTAKVISEICWKYKEGKGLILPYTKEIQKNVLQALQKYHPFVASRMKTHTDESKARDRVFSAFGNSKSNDILFSTYANQGYDGKDVDFCIIIKVPFGSLADIQVRKKMEMNARWYQTKAATELTQMCGRIVRSKENVGHTYIIDPSFSFHYQKGVGQNSLKTEMPKYICESIEVNRVIK